MGILDSLFSKKKKDSAIPKVMVELNINDYQKLLLVLIAKKSFRNMQTQVFLL